MIRRLASPGFPLIASAALAQTGADPQSIEQRFDAGIDSADQLAWLEDRASAPNHVGSPHNKANAEAILATFKSWGRDARIETFMVLYQREKLERLARYVSRPPVERRFTVPIRRSDDMIATSPRSRANAQAR